MWVRLQRIERGSKRNVRGKAISRRYCYVIVVYRWFKKPRYLYLLPNWFAQYMHGEPCNIELVAARGRATEFRDDRETLSYLKKSLALELIEALKKNPDNFILN